MFHRFQKSSSYLRTAIYHAYKQQCAYCGTTFQQRNMHIDHIVPTNMQESRDPDLLKYLDELRDMGFIVDSIENYLPACPSCNMRKSNRMFLANNLRYYHEMARQHSIAILNEIEKLQRFEQETFYEPVDHNQWEELTFEFQRDISSAIMGYRLTPADVLACPRFPQVEKLKEHLTIVDHVMLQGQPGCGKSISLYQAAYDYFMNGWHVYRYICGSDQSVPVIPQNSEQSLFLFDDAQNLSEESLQKVQEQARPTRKIMLAKTISSAINFDTIILTNQEAVLTLKNFCTNNIDVIAPIIHKSDRDVGVGYHEIPVEHRIQAAGSAVSPWVFSYTLRGGWKAIKSLYSIIRTHHRCGLLATLIAVFQVAQKDRNIDFDWFCQWIQQFDSTLKWTQEDLQYLVDKKVVLSIDDVRIVHIQSANTIIGQYLDDSTQDELLLLQKIVETAYCDNRISPLGIVWLCNGPRSYTKIWSPEHYFITDKMIHYTLNSLSSIKTSSDRMGIAYFWEKVLNRRELPTGVQYFKQNENMVINWLLQADNETAYAYGNLINALYNADRIAHQSIALQIDWSKFIATMKSISIPFYTGWARLINRLSISLPQENKEQLTNALVPYSKQAASTITTSNIIDFSEFLCETIYFNPYAHETILRLVPIYEKLFIEDMRNALDLFDFGFMMCFCGINFFGNRKVLPETIETASAIVEVIPEHKLATYISNSYPREWQHIYKIMCLIAKYDKKKARRIIKCIDVSKLASWGSETWSTSHEVIYICCTLALGNQRNAQSYIESCKKHITKIYSPIAICAPHYAVSLFDAGIPIELVTDHHWDIAYSLLKSLIKIDVQKTASIISGDIPNIVDKMNSTTALNFIHVHYLRFIECIADNFPGLFDTIAKQIDLQHIAENWEKASYAPAKKKTVYQRYGQFVQLIANGKAASL